MAVHLSTGLTNSLLGTSPLQTLLAGGELLIYSGAQPLSADDAPTGTLLVTINNAGAGLNFDAPVANVLSKAAAETWAASAAASGTAGWFRYQIIGDTGAASTTAVRIDGAIGLSGADMNISNTQITAGATQTVDAFSITLPLA